MMEGFPDNNIQGQAYRTSRGKWIPAKNIKNMRESIYPHHPWMPDKSIRA